MDSFCYTEFMKKTTTSITILIIFCIGVALFLVVAFGKNDNGEISRETLDEESSVDIDDNLDKDKEEGKPVASHPMAIEALRDREYLAEEFVIEETLPNGANYSQQIVSYKSDGLKIFGLLTVPLGEKPEGGFPAIVFIHGYIPPKKYSTTGNYPTYQARLARSGFVTFKPDLRGHGNSEGKPVSAHFSEAYVVDTLFALAYLKDYQDVDPRRIGYWGHSNGGGIGLKTMLVDDDIKALSLWAGVVGSYRDMLEVYIDNIHFLQRNLDHELIVENKLPSENPEFWNQIDPYYYLTDISAPIQLQHGTADNSVPVELSRRLKEELDKLDKFVELYEYEGDDHNISGNVNTAFDRAINFYKEYL